MASDFISLVAHQGLLLWLHPSSSAELKTSNQTLGRHVIFRGISCVPGLWCFHSVWSAPVQRISCLFCDWGRVFDSEFIALLVLTGTCLGKAGSQEGQEDLTPLIQLWLTPGWKNAARRIISGIFLPNLSIQHLSQILGPSSGVSGLIVQYERRKRWWLPWSLWCRSRLRSSYLLPGSASLAQQWEPRGCSHASLSRLQLWCNHQCQQISLQTGALTAQGPCKWLPKPHISSLPQIPSGTSLLGEKSFYI